MEIIYIGVFGIIGVFCRYFFVTLMEKLFHIQLPLDIFTINVIGSFLIGIIYVLGIEKAHLSQELRLGIMVGFLGGFTTFSSFSLDAVKLFESAKYLQCFLYSFLSPTLGILATFLGIFLARKF
ncbi:fluoride efflux transporter CrcB [Silvanigrella aquatica]|uniref:Fluoride-specific ion channel FluC n=1 Tax=Silvanigrella aquatica TaxID=1915309 RepID=A0A1L4CXK6_9BACT|nr:fluoride efflux transporter CrcB [Silvanigrella aquatica]APJ02676.1 hypothetical protein AXG55_01515 [Silvanigrella aquatica]